MLVRDKLMERLGTYERLIEEAGPRSLQWRKPLRIDEINRLAPTPEVKARPGRP